MANKKNFHYVLVFTDEGPVYVTSTDFSNRCARWDKCDEPLEFSKSCAEDIVTGLNINGFQAVLVSSKYEIDYQPYNYKDWYCKFERKSGNDDV